MLALQFYGPTNCLRMKIVMLNRFGEKIGDRPRFSGRRFAPFIKTWSVPIFSAGLKGRVRPPLTHIHPHLGELGAGPGQAQRSSGRPHSDGEQVSRYPGQTQRNWRAGGVTGCATVTNPTSSCCRIHFVESVGATLHFLLRSWSLCL